MDQTTTPPPSTPPTDKPAPKRSSWTFNPWRLFIGVLITLFGLSLLAQQYGWNWIAPDAVWKLWPVFIILTGVSMLYKGRMGGTIISIVMILVVVGLFLVASVGTSSTTTHKQTINIEKPETAAAARVSIDLGAAKIRLAGGATDLVSGTYETNDQDLRIVESTSGTKHAVQFTQGPNRNWFMMHRIKNNLQLRLTNEIPLEVTIDSGAADVDLNLTGVQITDLDINAGASSIDVTLDDLVAMSRVSIDSGAASFIIRLPQTAGVRANIDGGATSKNIPPELKKVNENQYETEGYENATKKIDVSIDAGASSITFQFVQ